jgi:hypothetical protein
MVNKLSGVFMFLFLYPFLACPFDLLVRRQVIRERQTRVLRWPLFRACYTCIDLTGKTGLIIIVTFSFLSSGTESRFRMCHDDTVDHAVGGQNPHRKREVT